jgi:hypothetical protein
LDFYGALLGKVAVARFLQAAEGDEAMHTPFTAIWFKAIVE